MTTLKQDGIFDWSFALQELRREQGVDTMSSASDARFVNVRRSDLYLRLR